MRPNSNLQQIMDRCRVKEFTYDFYHLPAGAYYPIACGVRKSKNPFSYFQLTTALRDCDGQTITVPLQKKLGENDPAQRKKSQRSTTDY